MMSKYRCIKELKIRYYKYNMDEIIDSKTGDEKYGYDELCLNYNPMFVDKFFVNLALERDQKIDEILND